MEWQPIETAPRNKQILLLIPEFESATEMAWTGSWSHVENKWCIRTPYLINHKIVIVCDIPQPKYWMPQPEPPK